MKAIRRIPRRVRQWLSGSILRKLTLFVVVVCCVLIALVWVLGVELLEPAYNTAIRADLDKSLDTIVSVLDQADADGVPSTDTLYESRNVRVYRLSGALMERLDARIYAGELNISNLCVDMSDNADGTARPLLVVDNLPSDCPLHHKDGANLFEESGDEATELLNRLRAEVFRGGSTYYETPQQMISGRLTGSGEIAVILSTNLERIPQAVGILRRLMLSVSLVLLAISVPSAFLFSRWFTKPLTRLSGATKEMTRGNYNVSVPAKGCDEIAELSRDFNQMAREVKRSAELQRDLIANVSHDLRTPLTLIKGYAETVRDLSGDDPHKRTEQLTVIVDETDRLSALVDSVMELSRVSSGHEKPAPVKFDLTQLCDELTFRYDALAAQQGYHFVFSGEEACEIQADPGLVERALHNLLGNALNHVGADGYVGLVVRRTARGTVRAEVIDHGPGIAPEDQPHLFDRYYRSRADAGKAGTGLGLSITKAIFDAHYFDYGVESKPGEGALFWFEAPLA